MPDTYSFCESEAAGSKSAWHIRRLTKYGRKLGGGSDSRALCGRTVSWDVNVDITDLNLPLACPKCVGQYRADTKPLKA
jgi:hypothetical protein